MPRKIPRKELAEHNKQDSLWLAVNGTIYDLTEFSSEHPGGVESEFNLRYSLFPSNTESSQSYTNMPAETPLLPTTRSTPLL